jgi:hypothetical protein
MKYLKFAFIFFILVASIAFPLKARAAWSFNFGYNNPPGAVIGANFLDFWTNFALEFGIGYVNGSSSSSKNSDTLAVAGDVNLKYLFLSSALIRPYLQGGFGLASSTTVGNNGGVALGTGGGFGGGGLFIKGRSVYAYGSYNISSSSPFWQAGLGFMF